MPVPVPGVTRGDCRACSVDPPADPALCELDHPPNPNVSSTSCCSQITSKTGQIWQLAHTVWLTEVCALGKSGTAAARHGWSPPYRWQLWCANQLACMMRLQKTHTFPHNHTDNIRTPKSIMRANAAATQQHALCLESLPFKSAPVAVTTLHASACAKRSCPVRYPHMWCSQLRTFGCRVLPCSQPHASQASKMCAMHGLL